ncbi:hypothetical protein EIN_253260 [Entamoeba invadens IP1]|uniref:Uncharacterized protein n=1 Tax=Entamoeba invadens IP1 TaxID=370355 RepID=A0A0A1UHC1_ENTIV|nr:hypothetical protein EIN_253260 [Entamoeba invadens IP1]ELP95062.1 hypothetical protein EIN_253260 [Entamoeba invadens IP1]|eukprot:XP_004261833.1 hypothetical protein EIN_253260 [Entamoeba invadens IP1]
MASLLLFAFIFGVLSLNYKATKKLDDNCNLACFLSGFKVNVNFNDTACGSVLGSTFCFKSLYIDEILLKSIDGKVDNVENPQSFSASLTLEKIHAIGTLTGSDLNTDIGVADLTLHDASMNFGMSMTTFNYKGYDLVDTVKSDMKVDLNSNEMDIAITCPTGNFLCKLLKFATNLGDLVSSILQSVLNKEIPTLEQMIDSNLTSIFNQTNHEYVMVYLERMEPTIIPVPNGMTNLTESSLFDMISWASTYLFGGNSSLGLNNLIDRFTKNTGSFVVGFGEQDTFADLSDTILNVLQFNNITIPDINGTLDFGLKFLNISGLNTWNKMEFFEPLRYTKSETNVSICESQPYCDQQLKISSGLQMLSINVSFTMNASADGEMINTSGKKLHEEGNLYVLVTDNYLEGRIQVAIPNGKFEEYSNNQCTNITCLLALFQNGTGIPLLRVNTSLDILKMTAASSSIEDGVQHIINSVADVFINRYKPVIPAFLNGLVNGLGGDAVNSLLEGYIGKSCDQDPDMAVKEYNTAVVATTISVAFVLSLLICCIAILFLVVKWRMAKQVDSEEKSTETADQEKVSECEENEKTKKPFLERLKAFPLWFCKQWTRTDPEGASLFLDSRVNIVIRVVIPFVILLGIALFLTSNTGVGATVNAYISIGNENTIVLPVADFGLMNSVKDMWTAKVYPLAILIMLFSGVWPYAKLAVLLFTFFMPSKIVPPKVRGYILLVLDALGKWSMLDSYVMVLMIVAFYFNIPLPIRHGDNVEDPVKINLYVDECYGFVTLLLGTLFSLVLSHVVVGVHNFLQHNPEDNKGKEGLSWKPLFMYTRFLVTKIVIPVFLFITFVLVMTGFFLTSFSFDFNGLAGWALKILGQSPERTFSVVDLGTQLPGAAKEPNSFAVRITQIVYFLTIVAIPILHLVSLFALWFLPLQRKFQSWLYHACEVFYAWSCIDVFVISVIAAIVELSQFASFMVEPMCGAKIDALGMSIDEIVAKFFGEEQLIEGHETCFEVKANLESGCWLLFVAVVLYTIVTIAMMQIVKRALAKRLPTPEELDKMHENCIEMKEENTDVPIASPVNVVGADGTPDQHTLEPVEPETDSNKEEEVMNDNIKEEDVPQTVTNDEQDA